MIALKNVLVATDFGEPAQAALVYGRELARKLGGTVHVLHVVEDIRRMGIPETYIDFRQWSEHALAEARRDLDKLVTDGDRTDLGVTTVAVLAQSPVSAILEYAEAHDIDLIVVGTHGSGVLGHVMMGNVAERVARLARCPVLVVRHPEREFVMPDVQPATTIHA